MGELTARFSRLRDIFHGFRIAWARSKARDGTPLIVPINRPLISALEPAITRGMGSMNYEATVIASRVGMRSPGMYARCRFAILHESTFAFLSR